LRRHWRLQLPDKAAQFRQPHEFASNRMPQHRCYSFHECLEMFQSVVHTPFVTQQIETEEA
jgi:hypothetical protein